MIKKGDIIDLDIKDFAFGGKGIGKIKLDDKDYIIFVQHAITGQLVKVKITKKKPKYACLDLREPILRNTIYYIL